MFKKHREKKWKRVLFKIIFFYIIPALVIIIYLSNLDVNKTPPCEEIISYKIGVLDPRFGITQEEFKNDIDQAVNAWRKVSGYTLFEYNLNGDLTISLIYDERQEITQKEQKLNTEIDQTSNVADSVKLRFTALEKEYSTLEQEYESRLASFNQMQTNYNSEVEYWNSKGGAPKNEYSKLESDLNVLKTQENLLEGKRLELNKLSDEIDTLVNKYNSLVNNINSNIATIEKVSPRDEVFDQGVYISDENGASINIYQFYDEVSFVRVLVHELGHALGLEHNDNPDSIMYKMNDKEDLKLSTQDIQDLRKRCELE